MIIRRPSFHRHLRSKQAVNLVSLLANLPFCWRYAFKTSTSSIYKGNCKLANPQPRFWTGVLHSNIICRITLIPDIIVCDLLYN